MTNRTSTNSTDRAAALEAEYRRLLADGASRAAINAAELRWMNAR